MSTLLDANQAIQKAFDDSTGSLTISGTGAGGKVDITASTPLPVTLSGASNLDVVASYNISFSNLTISYFQVVASTADAIDRIAMYETTGETIQLAIGGSGSEVLKLTIGPGCDQIIDVNIPAGSRIAVRTVGSNATAGSLILNMVGAV